MCQSIEGMFKNETECVSVKDADPAVLRSLGWRRAGDYWILSGAADGQAEKSTDPSGTGFVTPERSASFPRLRRTRVPVYDRSIIPSEVDVWASRYTTWLF